MKEKRKAALRRFKELFLYGVFGLGATLLNIAAYWALTEQFRLNYLIANALAWLNAFLFAFLTNKVLVFGSRSWTGRAVVRETLGFLTARLATGILDMALMWLLVERAGIGGVSAKIFVNAVVIAINYFASKFWIFKRT